MLAEKIYKIQKELEEKRAKRKRELPSTQKPPLPNTPTGPRPTVPRMPGPGSQGMPNSTGIQGRFPMDPQNSLPQQTQGSATSIPGPPGSSEQSELRNRLMSGPGSSMGQNGQIRPGMTGVANNPNMLTATQDQQPSMLMRQLEIPTVNDPKTSDINRVSLYYRIAKNTVYKTLKLLSVI